MADLSQYSDEELMIAAGLRSPTIGAQASVNPLSSMSDDELFKIAGVEPLQKSGGIFSKDWWLTRPDGSRIDPAKSVAGIFGTALDGLTFGLGDEIIAAGSSAFNDDLTYEQALELQRGAEGEFKERAPIPAAGLQIGSFLKTPLAGVSSLKSGESIFRAAPKIAAEGAAYGGAFGFAEGEGGFGERLEEAGDSAVTGAIVSGLIGTPIAGAGNYIARNSGKLKEIGSQAQRKAFGVRQGDYTKSAKELNVTGLNDDAQVATRVKDAMDWIIKNGKAGDDFNPQALAAAAGKEARKVNDTVRRLIDSTDKFGKKPKIALFRAREYVQKGGVPATQIDDYLNQIDDLEKVLKDRGTHAFLQEQKKTYGARWEQGRDDLNGFYRSLYVDLKNTLEDSIPQLKTLNKEAEKFQIALPILKRGVGVEEAQNMVERLADIIRNPRGGNILPAMTAGSAAGGALGGGAGAALGGGLAYLRTPEGQNAAGKLVQQLASRGDDVVSAARQFPGVSTAARFSDPLAGGRENIPQGSGQSPVERQSSPADPSARSIFAQGSAPSNESTIFATPSTQNPEAATAAGLPSEPPQILAVNRRPSGGLFSLSQQGAPSKAPSQNPIEAAFQRMSFGPEQESQFANDFTGESTVTENSEVVGSLVEAVIQQESAGKPNAVSPKGAQGLMQLMPATGREMMQELGMDPREYDPFDPELNVTLGTAYLQKLYDMFGDEELALAAYNWGMGNVRKAMRKANSSSWEGIKHLAPTETKKYVPMVLKRREKLIAQSMRATEEV